MMNGRGSLVPFLLLALVFCETGRAATSSSSNLLHNPSFEEPTEEGALPKQWEYGSSGTRKTGVTGKQTQTGAQCLQMTAYGVTGGFQAVEQTLSVKEGEKYEFSVAVKNSSQDSFRARDRSGTYGQLVIMWLDEFGQEIGRDWSRTWDEKVSRLSWKSYSIDKVEAPKGAVGATVGIHFYERSSGAEGSFLVDDVSLKRTSTAKPD